MGGYTRAVSGKRLDKHFPEATDTNATIEELCFLCSPCRDFMSKGQVYSSPLCTGVYEESTRTGGREIAIVVSRCYETSSNRRLYALVNCIALK
jgi:hypothetical protein